MPGPTPFPMACGSGGQFAVDWVRNVGYQNQMECILFSAETNTFTNFFQPLILSGQSFNPNFGPGGNIFDGYDSVRYYIHDVKTGADHSTAVVWETGFQPGVKARSLYRLLDGFCLSGSIRRHSAYVLLFPRNRQFHRI